MAHANSRKPGGKLFKPASRKSGQKVSRVEKAVRDKMAQKGIAPKVKERSKRRQRA